jgi:hypothetical protein
MKHLFILAAVFIALIFATRLELLPKPNHPPRFAQFTRLFTETANRGFDFSNELKEDLCTFPLPYSGSYTFKTYKGETGVGLGGREYYQYTLSFCAISTEPQCSAQK